ncbi:MAG: type I secretion system permease/ATPase [Pseudomonadota bacterium]
MTKPEENPVRKLQSQVASALPGLSPSSDTEQTAASTPPDQAEPDQAQPGAEPARSVGAQARPDQLSRAIADIAGHYGKPVVASAITAGLPLVSGCLPLEYGEDAAARAGLTYVITSTSPFGLPDANLPVLVLTKDQDVEILWEVDRDKTGKPVAAIMSLPGTPHQRITVPAEELETASSGRVIELRPSKSGAADQRGGEACETNDKGWFLSAFKDSRRIFAEAITATMAVNILGLAVPLFSMNVYDRVLPNAAETTLWALALGVAIAILFDVIIRTLRASAVDAASRRADARLSAMIFGRLLGAKQSTQPVSTGVRANTLREFETLRDFFNSATLTAFGDLPFLALFLVVLWIVAGPLVWIVVACIPLLLGIGYLTQRALGKLIEEAFREAAQKNAVATETVSGLETIKAAGAESWAALKWEQAVAEHIRTGIAIRRTTNLGQHIIHGIQTSVQVLIVVFGYYMVVAGDLTMGGLIAATILSGRALQPLTQAAHLLTRLNQARMAYVSLSQIVNAQQERTPSANYLAKTDIKGRIRFEDVAFVYAPMTPPALSKINLDIAPGQHTAIIGGIGSGKTTVLKLMQGIHEPTTGRVLIDDVSIAQVEPVLLRRQVALLLQDAVLFHGTLRENIAMADPAMTDETLLQTAQISGAMKWISRLPMGFETPIRERGVGLSGGQRQSLVLARALAADPSVLLLDEPTSEMDGQTERDVIQALKSWANGRTLVVVTHRPALLELARRMIVMDNGQVVEDGPKDGVLESLKARTQKARTQQVKAEKALAETGDTIPASPAKSVKASEKPITTDTVSVTKGKVARVSMTRSGKTQTGEATPQHGQQKRGKKGGAA